jgi:hypothetical protein
MIKNVLVLAAVLTLSASLECYVCGTLQNKPSPLQLESFKRVISKLHMGRCHEGAHKECSAREDECQRVEVKSRLGDDTAPPVAATVYKCGQSYKRETLCRTLKLSGQLFCHVRLDQCAVEACSGDKCFIP